MLANQPAHAPHPSRRIGLVLIALVAGLAAMGWGLNRPAQVQPGRRALADIIAVPWNRRVQSASVTVAGLGTIPLRLGAHDRLWPERPLPPATRALLYIHLAATWPWTAWLPGPRRLQVSLATPAPPAVQLAADPVPVGHAPALTWGRPVTAVRYRTNPAGPWVSVPGGRRQLTLPLAPVRPGQRGTVWVSVKDRPWERWGPAARLRWEAPAPLAVASTSPGWWQHGVPATSPVIIRFSQPLSATSLRHPPTLNPAVPGRWTIAGHRLIFRPAGSGFPAGVVSLQLPAGPQGPRAQNGAYLLQPVQRQWFVYTPYRIVVSETLPETLTLYRNGHPIWHSLANTGIAAAPTPLGTFYVETKVAWVNMRGTDPDGQPYYVPHVPWVLPLVGNVAIHGYVRARYGFPQSVGCIELPPAAAHYLYQTVPIGTPVTILPPATPAPSSSAGAASKTTATARGA